MKTYKEFINQFKNNLKTKINESENLFKNFFMRIEDFWIWNYKIENGFETTLEAIIYSFYKYSNYEQKLYYEETYSPFYKLPINQQKRFEETYDYMLKNNMLFRMFTPEMNILTWFPDLSGNNKMEKREFLSYILKNNNKIYITKK